MEYKKKRNQRDLGCQHKRIKKNYPFGKKSGAIMKCKDCKEMVTRWILAKLRKNKTKNRRQY